MKADSLKTCGERARIKELTYFGLRDNQCYCSSNLSDFIMGGPSDSCRDGLEVYQITEQENFDLSVRAYESCGPGYCREELVCSGGMRTVWSQQAYATLHVTLFILWAITQS